MASTAVFISDGPRTFPEITGNKGTILLFNSDFVKFLLKTNRGVTESLILLFF